MTLTCAIVLGIVVSIGMYLWLRSGRIADNARIEALFRDLDGAAEMDYSQDNE